MNGTIDQFVEHAIDEHATVEWLGSDDDVPGRVLEYLVRHRLSRDIVVAGNVPAGEWPSPLNVAKALPPDGGVAVTGCLAGIAESGAVAVASGPDHRAEWGFLSLCHIAVVQADQIVADYEAFWDRLAATPALPRLVNFILGPSRTADLGVPSKLGAHGPARLHVLLVGAGTAATGTNPAGAQ